MTYQYKVELPAETYTPDVSRMKANERRKLANLLFDDWFKKHNLDLGRDYYLSIQFSNAGWQKGYIRVATIEIKDPKTAMLFKLVYG